MSWNRYPYISTSGDVVVGDDAFEQMLGPVTGGQEILVGAGFGDPDLAALAGLVNTSGVAVGGGDILVGGSDILVGAGFGPEFMDPGILTGATTPQNQALVQQNRMLQAQLQQARRQGAQIIQAARQANARPVGNVAKVVNEGEQKLRKIHLGINSDTNILAGQTRNVTTRPQVKAKPFKLTISNGDWWRIIDIKVGNKSQLAASGAIPGEVFAPNATDGTLICDTASVSQDVIVVVENRTGADHRFEATFLCYIVD